MESLKAIGSSLKSNPVGLVAGAAAGYFGAKKLGKISNKWALIGLTVVGAIVGATIQGKIKAKKSAPTAATVVTK